MFRGVLWRDGGGMESMVYGLWEGHGRNLGCLWDYLTSIIFSE